MKKTQIPDSLGEYFTDMEDLIGQFYDLVSGEFLSKRILLVNGIGGVGKSSLLRMFNLDCEAMAIPVGIVQGTEVRSPIDILDQWEFGWGRMGAKLKDFRRSLQQYKKIQSKLQTELSAREQLLEVGSSVTKIGVEAATNLIPVAGPIVAPMAGAFGGAIFERVSGIAKSLFNDKEQELLLDPVKKLTDKFLEGTATKAENRRTVLMIDGLDQVNKFDSWVIDLLTRLHPNILIVLASRAIPRWNVTASNLFAQTIDCKVMPMKESDMRKLAHRYARYLRVATPSSGELDSIVRFARGLPIVVNSAVQLLAIYRVTDFDVVKPRVVADLADSFRRGVPRELYPLLEIASAVRWSNKDVLRVLAKRDDIDSHFELIRDFPIVYPCIEGFALHDEIRQVLEENLKIESPQRYIELHNSALGYFESLLSNSQNLPKELTHGGPLLIEKLITEKIYHSWKAAPEKGFFLLAQEFAQAFRTSNLVLCDTLIGEAQQHSLTKEQTEWMIYWKAELSYRRGAWFESSSLLRSLLLRHDCDSLTRVAASLTLGKIRYQQGALSEAESIHQFAVTLAQQIQDVSREAILFEYLAKNHRMQGNFKKAEDFHQIALEISHRWDDKYQICSNLGGLGTTMILAGNLNEGVNNLGASIEIAERSGFTQFIATGKRSRAAGLVMLGRIQEAETDGSESLRLSKQMNDLYNEGFANLVLGQVNLAKKNYRTAERLLRKSIQQFRDVGARFDLGNALVALASVQRLLGQLQEALDTVLESERILEELNFKYGLAWQQIERGRTIFALSYDIKAVRDQYEQGRQIATAIESAYAGSTSLIALAGLDLTVGNISSCRTWLEQSKRIAEAKAFIDHQALINLNLGKCELIEEKVDYAIDFFAAALIKACQFNEYLLDSVVEEIILICKSLGFNGAQEISQKLLGAGQNEVRLANADRLMTAAQRLLLDTRETDTIKS